MDAQQVELGNDTVDANSVKDLVLYKLLEDKVITEEQAEKYSTEWQVIIIKNNWFTKWVDKFKKDKNAWSYKYINFC